MPAFTYGWGGKKDTDGQFWIRFDACTRQSLSWKEELFAAARAIAENTTKPLWLCSSGGIDSEAMCRAFREQEIPFSVLTLRFENGMNDFDISHAIRWCKENGVRQLIHDINMEEFLTHGIERFIGQGYATMKSYHYLKIYMLELIEEMGGFGVVGSGEQHYIVDPSIENPSPEDVYLDLGVGYVASLEWCRRRGLRHEPFFLHHTPELNLATLEFPFFNYSLAHPAPFRSRFNRFYIKQFMYHTVWIDMLPRIKYDGFERIQPLTAAATERLKEAFGPRLESCKIPIPEFRSQLRLQTGEAAGYSNGKRSLQPNMA